jgi:hypothetical protein
MRLFSVILIVVGIVIFIGNITGSYRTLPGLGIALILIGALLLRYVHTPESLSAGVEEWH